MLALARRQAIVAAAPAGVVAGGTTAGSTYLATCLTLIRCRQVTLSVVEFPPNVPQPSVNDGSSPVVAPQTPCAPGEFTSTRLAGIANANRSTCAGSVVCT